MTMPQFDERWNIAWDSLRHFKNGYLTFPFLSYQHVISLFIVVNRMHALRIV